MAGSFCLLLVSVFENGAGVIASNRARAEKRSAQARATFSVQRE
jgi:hypothetical protein